MLIKQTHTKPQETIKFMLTQPRETFSFKPPINLGLDSNWMVRLTSLEVYKSFFNITTINNNFELYTDLVDEFSFTELKDELEEILDISNITPEHLQEKILGRHSIKANKKLESERRRTDANNMLLMGCARSPFRDFESFLRIVVGLDEDNFQLLFKQSISNFVTNEISAGICSKIYQKLFTLWVIMNGAYEFNMMILA